MAKEWAKEFYQSKNWQAVRDLVMCEADYICQICKRNPAEIVHHMIWLNTKNINDVNITLNKKNLIAVCRECHAQIHEGVSATPKGLTFNEKGELVCNSEYT